MSAPLRVLLVEDSPIHADLLARELRRSGYNPTYERVDTAEAMRAALAREPWDLVISDYYLPEFSGLEALRILKESGLDLPFIIVTGSVGEDLAVEAMKAGAHDYLLKGNLARLGAAIEREIREADGRRACRRAEEGLRESEARLRLLIGQMPAVMWTTDTDLHFTSALGAGLAAMNLRPHQVIGMSLPEYFQTDDPDFPPIAAHRGALKGDRLTCEMNWRGRSYQAHVEPHHSPDGTITGTIGIALDITERKILEEHLRLSQKMEAVGRLAGGIAHEFNNLLACVLGYSELLLRQIGPGDSLRVPSEAIRKAAERGAILTRQILAFGRKQLLTPQVLDLNDLVSNLSDMLRHLLGEEIEMVILPEADLGRVEADPGQIEQAIMNLALNAREAMPRGGRLTIRTASVASLPAAGADGAGGHTPIWQLPEADVRPGPYVVLSVSDTGCGMDAETRAHIFEPFFTTKGCGEATGLGLATVFGIVKQSGGEIRVDSEPGSGTTFRIYLPRVEEAVPPRAREEPLPATGSETILLVEDEDAVRGLALHILESHGYRVLEARSGSEALAEAQRFEDPLHLVLTDVVMPGMSGREMAEQLQSQRPGIKVLYMSGYTDDAVIQRGALQQGAGFLHKPFSPNALLRKIRELLEGVGSSDGQLRGEN
jgi:two-component system cell cycle sensor histidine kinase/response regulator CckA